MGEVFAEYAVLWPVLWQSTAVLALGLGGSFALRKRAVRAHQFLLLAMVAALVVPVLTLLVKQCHWGLLTERVPPVEAIETQTLVVPETPRVEIPEPALVGPLLPVEPAPPGPSRIQWARLILPAGGILSIILVIRLAISFVLGRRLVTQSQACDARRITEAIEHAKTMIGIGAEVRLRSSVHTRNPVIWCWGLRPILLVPEGSQDNETIDWPSVVCHELAHWKRRDHLSGLWAELVVCALPWNPLSWWAKRRLVHLSEEACDDWTIASGQRPTSYARTLLGLTAQKQTTLVPGIVTNKKTLAARVRRILTDRCGNPRSDRRWTLAIAALATCLAVTLALAQTRPVAAPSDTATDSKTAEPVFVFDMEIRDANDIAAAKLAAPTWRKRFDEVYHLAEGEVLKRIAPPFIPERETRYYGLEKGMAEQKKPVPPSLLFHWIVGGLDGSGGVGRETATVRRLLTHLVGLKSFEYNGPETLLDLELPGDWIVRGESGREVKLRAIETLIQTQFGRAIRFEQQTVERAVIVVTGQFEFQPLRYPSVLRGNETSSRFVHLYAVEGEPDRPAGGTVGVSASHFLECIGHYLAMPVIDRTTPFQVWGQPIAYHESASSIGKTADAEQRRRLLGRLFANLTEQTGLIFTIEKQPTKVWTVTEQGTSAGPQHSKNVPEHKPRDMISMTYASHSQPAWQKRFDEVYRLNDGEIVKHITPPFIPERKAYYLSERAELASRRPEPPSQFWFGWDGVLQPGAYSFVDTGYTLRAALTAAIGLHDYQYEGPPELLGLRVPGDWIVRTDASLEAKLHALEAALDQDLGYTVRFEKRPTEQIVVIASGQWKYHALYEDELSLLIFAGESKPGRDEIERHFDGTDSISELLEKLGPIFGATMIDRTSGIQETNIPFQIYLREPLVRTLPDLEEKRRRVEGLLAKVTAQTELQFEVQIRPGYKWVVTEGEEAN